jgi:hypothetical protein
MNKQHEGRDWLAKEWANARAAHRAGIIAFSDIADAYVSGFDAAYRNETPKLIQALREAVAGLNYVADHENIGRAVYSDTDPERARQSLTNIEKILNGEQK